MRCLIQLFFAVTLFVAGYHCNVPNVAEIFEEPEKYALNTDQWRAIDSTFNSYKQSENNMQKSLRENNIIRQNGLIGDISRTLSAHLGYFEDWIKLLKWLDKETETYVGHIREGWTKMLREDREKIGSYNESKMSELINEIRIDENLARNQLRAINDVGSLIIGELVDRKEDVSYFNTHLQFGDGYVKSLEKILKDVQHRFTLENLNNNAIQDNLKSLTKENGKMKEVMSKFS